MVQKMKIFIRMAWMLSTSARRPSVEREGDSERLVFSVVIGAELDKYWLIDEEEFVVTFNEPDGDLPLSGPKRSRNRVTAW